MTHHQAKQTVDRVTDSPWFERAARAGYLVTGLLHLLIAYIVMRIAFGGGGSADQSGALAVFAGEPGGQVVLWVAAVAFAALALWRLAEAILGGKANDPDSSDGGLSEWFDRGKALALFVLYLGLAWSAINFATGGGQSSGQQNAGMSARLMQHTGGKVVLVIVGLIVIGVGAYFIYKGVTKNFLDDLRRGGGTAVTTTGVIGYTAKGAVIAGAGILVIVAALQADPSKAAGIDAAIKTLAGLPAGQILLILAAVGLAAYGVYCFVMSRWARM
ncbi:DUF1206 domain-containing protein [Gordonia sp. Z-3]|uniref:DUF1206 domain-containing protein n=1 Tax=unclassified Gordonia (in: high G+C Gram-positive bacteria) TaxID=2657482 RepID=UPI000C5D4237|nr:MULTISPECIES: DUF1206 domain-containing protein [unclassified Gordonia (in: high G+C Gram-positive bacteria)]MAU84575.1 hypothetical protein [Gordonia sp. (in: high G+C Gram-positive bacteria)]MED5801995.1 DUF1206 domain-containing protein [Gordonia sp. Z-3]